MDIVDRLSPIAVEKEKEILNVLQGVPIKDAQLSLKAAMYSVNTCLEEQTKKTVFYDNQIVKDWLDAVI